MGNLATIQQSTEVSEINAFEITIQEHEKELNFVPDMTTKEGRKSSADAVKDARKTYVAIDAIRLEKKKEAEQLANAIHAQGKEALGRLEAGYTPHKMALDAYKHQQKELEEARKLQFFDACQWLNDIANECQFASTEQIIAMTEEVKLKDLENTGLDLSKDQRFEYGKIHVNILPKLEQSLQQRIIKDAEEDRQRKAAAELAEQQENMRQQQEAFEAEQQKLREQQAAQAAKELAEKKAKEQAELAEAESKKKIADAEKNAKLAEEREEQAKKQAAIDAEDNRIAEQKRLKQAELQAAENERLRIQQEKDQAEAEEKARKANRAHKGKIMGEAKIALMAKDISEDVAKEVLKLIAANKIPHVSIKF